MGNADHDAGRASSVDRDAVMRSRQGTVWFPPEVCITRAGWIYFYLGWPLTLIEYETGTLIGVLPDPLVHKRR